MECQHTFSPDYPEFPEYEGKGDDEAEYGRWLLDDDIPGVTDGEWSCPHTAVPDHRKCPFHLPPEDRPPNVDATAAFLGCIERARDLDTRRERRRAVQFVDATFESFDVAGEVIDAGDANYINLAHAHIAGADFTDTVVRQPIRFAHATLTGASTFRSATFEGTVGMRNATFEGPARFKGATFERPFSGKHATFESPVYFWHTVFRRHAIFYDVAFREYAYFRGVDFDNYVRFSHARFGRAATFKLGEFGDDADFDHVRFEGEHSFTDAEFERTTDFSDVTAAGPMDLSGTDIEDLRMTPESVETGSQYVDLAGSLVRTGELGQPASGDILYDAEGATLGDVAVTTPGTDPVVDHVRLVATNYEGFEFESDDMAPETADWDLHQVFDESMLPEARREPLSDEVLRETYLKAKNGAKRAGNTTAAGRFYYKEMEYRRKHLAGLVASGRGGRLRRGFDWFRNAALFAITGYGERPHRVVGFSVGTVLAFGAVYDRFTDVTTSASDAVLFSFQSFITFIVGAPPQETTPLVTFVSIFEGFLGAFFIALFVYTFTRRLNR